MSVDKLQTVKSQKVYRSVDSLPNKKQELMSVINNAPCKPKIIALTEIKGPTQRLFLFALI